MEAYFKKRNIYVYNGTLDFRKQMNGLIHLVNEEMKSRPNDGNLYVFRNRGRDKLKILMWDRNGFVLGYKRLEKGHFDFPKGEGEQCEITHEQLYMMVSGMPMIYLGKGTEKSTCFS